MSHSEYNRCVQDLEWLIEEIPISKSEFASELGVSPESSAWFDRSSLVQRRLQEAMDILNRVQPWAGGMSAAWYWYRSQPIPALDGRTASELVSCGRGDQILAYLAVVAEGGYS